MLRKHLKKRVDVASGGLVVRRRISHGPFPLVFEFGHSPAGDFQFLADEVHGSRRRQRGKLGHAAFDVKLDQLHVGAQIVSERSRRLALPEHFTLPVETIQCEGDVAG